MKNRIIKLGVVGLLSGAVLVGAGIPGANAVIPTVVSNNTLSNTITLNGTPGTTNEQLTSLGYKDSMLVGSYTLSQSPGVGSKVYTRYILRATGNTRYSLVLASGEGKQTNAQIEKVVNGATTILSNISLPETVFGAKYNVKFQVKDWSGGTALGYRYWKDGSEEPTDWTASVDDTLNTITNGTGSGFSTYQGSTSTSNVVTNFTEVKLKDKSPVSVNSPEYLSGWGEPSFSDNFDGTQVDNTKWQVKDDTYLGYDVSTIKSENVSVDGQGHLIINTKKMTQPKIWGDNKERWYSTGYIDTIGKFSQEYGRFEIRAKLPTVKGNSQGIWPSFWMRPDNGQTGGELDVFEAYGSPNTKTKDTSTQTEGTIHYWQTGSPVAGIGKKTSGWTLKTIDVNDGEFHVWALEYTPSGVKWLLDGQVYYEVSSENNPGWAVAFDQGTMWHMRVNTQVGSDYWGMPEDGLTAPDVDYIVDYVRAYSYDK